jgi:glucose/arabinose dehydrogenase
LTPKPGAAPQQSTLLDGLDQPHGMAFAGATLYVAESNQIDAYDYVNGAATNPRTLAADLPDARSPELNGAYAHALKSVAVGPDGAVYFSIGSTATPTPRARRSCEYRGVAVAPNRSRRASATGPASPSHPTVRCGRR